jgi:hypothetical protein
MPQPFPSNIVRVSPIALTHSAARATGTAVFFRSSPSTVRTMSAPTLVRRSSAGSRVRFFGHEPDASLHRHKLSRCTNMSAYLPVLTN